MNAAIIKSFIPAEAKQLGGENGTHQREVNQLYQPSTGHKSICQVFDGLNHIGQLKIRKRLVNKLTQSLELIIFRDFAAHLPLFFSRRSEPSISFWEVNRGWLCTNWRLLWTWLIDHIVTCIQLLLWLTLPPVLIIVLHWSYSIKTAITLLV